MSQLVGVLGLPRSCLSDGADKATAGVRLRWLDEAAGGPRHSPPGNIKRSEADNAGESRLSNGSSSEDALSAFVHPYLSLYQNAANEYPHIIRPRQSCFGNRISHIHKFSKLSAKLHPLSLRYAKKKTSLFRTHSAKL
jgi:hypothetical protein